jgi:hypothetical protein
MHLFQYHCQFFFLFLFFVHFCPSQSSACLPSPAEAMYSPLGENRTALTGEECRFNSERKSILTGKESANCLLCSSFFSTCVDVEDDAAILTVVLSGRF